MIVIGNKSMTAGVAASLVLAAALAVGASGAIRNPAAPKALGTVVLRLGQDYDNLNPYHTPGRATPWAAAAPGYDRLVTFGPKGSGSPYVPYLATSWTQNAKSVSFKLRRDAKCSDGHVLTPVDILQAIKMFIDIPKVAGTFGSNSIGGFGPGPFHLRASNAKGTFTFSSDTPYRNFVSQFAQVPIICPEGLALLKSDPNALNDRIYGSGPYTLVSATHSDQVVWKLRPEWKWGPKGTSTKTMPQQLVYKVIADDTTAANLLITGGLNFAQVSGPDVPRLLANKQLLHKVGPNYLVWNLVFMMKPGSVFADEALRSAVTAAIDKKSFLQAATAGFGVTTPSVFRPGSECYEPATAKLQPAPSVDKAKQILTQAGYTYSGNRLLKGGQQVKARLVLTPLMNQGPDYIFSVLNSLGFDVDFVNLPGSTYGTNVIAGNFDVTILRGSIVAKDAGLNLFPFSGPPSPAGTNRAWTGVGDTQLNYYLNTGQRNPGQNGCKVFSLYQKRLLDKHYLVPLIGANYDLFGNGVDFPIVPPDQGPVPVFYLKAR